jgi:hypothetical protein
MGRSAHGERDDGGCGERAGGGPVRRPKVAVSATSEPARPPADFRFERDGLVASAWFQDMQLVLAGVPYRMRRSADGVWEVMYDDEYYSAQVGELSEKLRADPSSVALLGARFEALSGVTWNDWLAYWKASDRKSARKWAAWHRKLGDVATAAAKLREVGLPEDDDVAPEDSPVPEDKCPRNAWRPLPFAALVEPLEAAYQQGARPGGKPRRHRPGSWKGREQRILIRTNIMLIALGAFAVAARYAFGMPPLSGWAMLGLGAVALVGAVIVRRWT